ncbi:hypothetical protein [Citromicrobium bathyomarinum]|uniref:hypothetical protein n=1 Tax=Citromicrobium bathyomarinum TaxID=72174 RepID=UPI00315B1679
MRKMIASTLCAALVLTHGAAWAKTYEEAAASGVSPVTADEILQCSFYWDAWARSLNPDFYGEGKGIWDPGFIAKLNPAVQLPAAAETAKYWSERAKAKFKEQGKSKAYEEGMKNAPDYDVQALDERKFMELLGKCARPAK